MMQMTRRTTVALVNLSLCGLLALGGCKSSHPIGFAKKITPRSAAESALAESASAAPGAASGTQLGSADVARKQSGASKKPVSSSFARTFRKATSWFPFQRSDDNALKQTRTLDRELMDRELTRNPVPTIPGRFGVTSNATAQPNAFAYPPANFRTSTPSRSGAPQSTPSLVRHSRRPPPDPAPKPPQEELLATKTLTRNPYVPSSAGAHATAFPTRGKLSRAIATASRSWRADLARAVTADRPANHTSNNAELKFSPPNIKKNSAASSAMSLALAKGSGEAKQRATSDQRPARKGRSDTIPRREDMLVARAERIKNDDKSASPKSSVSKRSSTVPAAKWVAKKTSPSTASPEKDTAAPAVTNTPADPKRVVAETFANGMFAPRTPTKPRNSTFRLPPNKMLAQGQVAPKTVTNPHVASGPRAASPSRNSVAGTPARTRPAALAPRATAAAKRDSSKRTTTTMPGRVAQSTASQPAATGDGVRPKSVQRRTMAWQKPVPVVPSNNSYRSYYHRGVLPSAAKLARRPQHPAAVVSPAAVTNTAAPPVEHVAPLIDAESYRRQTAQRQQDAAVMHASAARPAAQTTWLTAYQELVRGASSSQRPSSAPTGATVRSLQSDQ